MNDYNCEPLTVERLRQSAHMTQENAAKGLPDSAWQEGIQNWAADELERLRGGVRTLLDESMSKNMAQGRIEDRLAALLENDDE